MTPEEIKELCPEFFTGGVLDATDYQLFVVSILKALAESRKQLQAEKARADKAEEMVAALQKRPEIGPPPVFEEEMNCEHYCVTCGASFSRLASHYNHSLIKQVSALRWQLGKAIDSYLGNIPTTEMVIDDWEGFIKAYQDTEQTAQAHNKRLCDELVGKIEAKEKHLLACNAWQYSNGFCDAIEIIKSVLGGEGYFGYRI